MSSRLNSFSSHWKSAHTVPHDLLKRLKVQPGEDRTAILGDEDQVRMEHEITVPASAHVPVFAHEAN